MTFRTIRVRFLAAIVLFFVGGALSACGANPFSAHKDGFSRAETAAAQHRVDKAVQMASEVGAAEVIRRINEESLLFDGAEYVFVLDARSGRIVAHPASPELVGQPLSSIATAGNESLIRLLDAGESGDWTEYVWTNPQTGEWERKKTWAVLSGGYIYGSGAYSAK